MTNIDLIIGLVDYIDAHMHHMTNSSRHDQIKRIRYALKEIKVIMEELEYKGDDSNIICHCGKEFARDVVIKRNCITGRDPDGTPFMEYEVKCPHCGRVLISGEDLTENSQNPYALADPDYLELKKHSAKWNTWRTQASENWQRKWDIEDLGLETKRIEIELDDDIERCLDCNCPIIPKENFNGFCEGCFEGEIKRREESNDE